jgi:hypothetical protein
VCRWFYDVTIYYVIKAANNLTQVLLPNSRLSFFTALTIIFFMATASEPVFPAPTLTPIQLDFNEAF